MHQQITHIADACHGFVGADLAALCREAGLHVLNRCFSEQGVRVRVCSCLCVYGDVWMSVCVCMFEYVRHLSLHVHV